MDAPASIPGLRFPGTRLRAPSVVGRPGMRVTLGPSLSHWRQDLQRLLGQEWVVGELISGHAPPEAEDVVVLGTSELPAGEIEPGRTARPVSLLIGTGPPALSDAGAEPFRQAVDRLAAALRALAANSPPEVARVATHAAS